MQAGRFNRLIAFNTRESFDELYRYYYPRVVMHIAAKYADKSLAEDTAQELFRQLLLKPPQGVNNPTAYLFTAANHIAYDIYKRGHGNDNLPLEVAYDVGIEQITDDGVIKKVLSMLSKEDRTLIIMKVYEGYTLKEIAAMQGTNGSTVRSQYRRAIAKCEKLYKEQK